MPPQRTKPNPAAIKIFNCKTCDKGYARQIEYENHLSSYDHNHRQRMIDMKKTTDDYDKTSAKPKQGLEMRRIDVQAASKMPGVGFKKLGGASLASGPALASGPMFRKIGKAATAEVKKEDGAAKGDGVPTKSEEKTPGALAEAEKPVEVKKDEDIVMEDAVEDEAITWEEYDFTKPTGCDHANCPGRKTDGIWDDEKENVDTA
ncbi:hypothetical protein N0V83_000961 [Neocucurbitaria cava]|uniref:C2H2-type domain-containing protein n=1 Tax=Neocucurbitaria cava TaxID=798079 RepID=A0A9W9CSH0_9PLEO|nr:hypothetical protein N0V83_000961 [Neocucurbitaria cava]